MIGGTYDLGNAQINGGGAYQFSLKVIPEQCVVTWLNITITCTVTASATYSFTNSAPQLTKELGDDVDLVLAAIINGIDLNISPSFQSMANLSPPRIRTFLGYAIGQDIQAPVNATSIATTGTALSFTIQIPMSLERLVPDLSVLNQGALRFAAAGQLNINYAALNGGNFTGTFVNGTTTFTIAPASVGIRLQAKTKQVSFGPGLVGSLWDLKYTAGAPVTSLTKPGIHLGLFDQTGQPQTGVSNYAPSAYNIFNGANSIAQNASPAQQIANYRQERVLGTFVDITNRGIPMMWYQPSDTLSDIDQSGSQVNYQVTEAQSQTLAYLELIVQPPNSTDLADIARRLNGGGKVAVDRGLAKSMGGKRPSSAVAPLLPVIMYPAGSAPAGLPQMMPADVGNYVSQAIQATVAAAKSAQPMGRVGHQLVGRR